MPARPFWSLDKVLGGAFPARRIYVRSKSHTRYLALGQGSQIAGLAAIGVFLAWSAFTTWAYVTQALDGHADRVQLETMREAYEAKLATFDAEQRRLEEELNQANLRRDAITERLSEKQARLVETAGQMREAEAELTVLRDAHEASVGARREEAARIAFQQREIDRLSSGLAAAETSRTNFAGAFEALSSAMDRVIGDRDRALSERSRLDGEVSRLSSVVARSEDRQERLLSQVEDAARISFAGLERMFSRSNIDLDRILTLARRDYTGSGGPFEPVTTESDTEVGDARVAALMRDLETVNLMRFAAERLPFGEPVFGGRKTSGFGVRSDPKRRGKAMHAGLDIAAPRGTAIYSTAEGVVTFAGRQRGYGIMVKIRHAFGFETVYAHLSRARVKVGQRVARGDRIADMGSTGRSTGTHLHYEIRIDNEPVNPIKFLEAARDVL